MKKYNNNQIKQIIAETGLPKGTRFKGYVIHLPKSDEFLAQYDSEDKDYLISYKWSKTPEIAIIFKEHIKAIEILKSYDKCEIMLCLLLDIGKQLVIVSEYDALDILGLN